MTVTTAQLFDVLTPLLLALHHKGVLDIAEVPHYYEDVLARRVLEKGEDAESTAFLRDLTQGLHRLAAAVKK